jgi:signal transduction histidine kinase
MDVFPELVKAAPLALLFSLPVAIVGGLLLEWMRRRSITAAMTALVLVPVTAALVGVLGVSGFMYTPQLVGTVAVCLVVGAVTVPAGLLLGHRVAREALWQREVRETERRLEASRQELVAGMSHDLRSPLAGILGMADALVDGVVHEPHEVTIYLGRIRRETVRMTTMVEDLFELSRAKSGTMQLRTTRLALGEVCSDAVAAEAAAAASAGVAVVATDPQAWPTVLGSDTELTRVVRNLLSNGVRHTPAGGVVRLTAEVRNGEAQLAVQDACGGIPPEELPRVFDVGFRGTSARTPGEHVGAGLGLAIAKALVEAQHGRIAVVNEAPGCRFVVSLPLAEGGAKREEPAPLRTSGAAGVHR